MNPKVDFYFARDSKWQAELKQLRVIALGCGLTEELKWGVPCYTMQGRNIILIHDFKEYCAFLFFKGALLQDVDGILIQQTENVQAARQIRFTKLCKITEQEALLKAYIFEAVAVEEAGLKVPLKKYSELAIPEELRMRLAESTELCMAFEALTPGRQRAYSLYLSAPKQAKTRLSRIKKCTPQILLGKGLRDE